MLHRTTFRICVLLAGLGLVLSAFAVHAQGSNRRGRKYKAPPPSSTITVTVLKADNGQPIENASVIFHPIEGDRDRGGMELKTNGDGKAMIDVIPVGDTVRLQVLARGFQTYGQDYKVDKTEMSMEVKLKRPVPQYSIYKDNKPAKDNGEKSGNGSGNGTQDKAPEQNQQPPK
jgi:hypothetical protein